MTSNSDIISGDKKESAFDALLIVSYGGPEGADDVVPFIENVLGDRHVPRERIEMVAQKYQKIGNVSPVNEECRALISGLLRKVDPVASVTHLLDKPSTSADTPLTLLDTPSTASENMTSETSMTQVRQLPIYWGNLFWYPMLDETIEAMANDQIRRVVAFCTVPFETAHSLRSYSKAIGKAVEKTGTPDFSVCQTRAFGNHYLYTDAVADRLLEVLTAQPVADQCVTDQPVADQCVAVGQRSVSPRNVCPNNSSNNSTNNSTGDLILFTSHSVPKNDAEQSNYEQQLRKACAQVADRLSFLGHHIEWDLAFQSRSGSNPDVWCGPDVRDFVRDMQQKWPQKKSVIACPIGFLFENAELLHDLDIEVGELCRKSGLSYARAFAVGSHQNTVTLIRRLVADLLPAV